MTIERKLSQVLSEFARTLSTDFPIQSILDHLVDQIVHVLPIDAAGVTLIAPGEAPRYVAASNDEALRYEQLQTELNDGPCVAASEVGEAVAMTDLRSDDRFGRFSERALALGLGAVFTFPLRHGEEQLGALDLYRCEPGRLSPSSMAAAQTLADVATAYLLNARARTELKESSEHAHHVSLHDPLTGLPNRTLLAQRLEHAVLRTHRSDKVVAVLFADLDGFKAINDSYGHHVGDELLIAVAERLTHLLRPGDTIARLGGDEFVIMCEDLQDEAQAEPLAERIGAAFAEPFTFTDVELRVTASIGIAFAGRGEDVIDQVLQDADTAMYQAKRRGGDSHAVLDIRDPGSVQDHAELDRDLRGALQRGELRTVYQPIVEVESGVVTGVEALLRWDHPTRGTVPPATVIPLAERAGLINEIGRWVLTRACLDERSWETGRERRRLGVAVNVSAHQLMRSGFADSVAAVLAETGTAPETLTLEITESVFVQDIDRVRVVLGDLKELGVSIALDDFGTGFSSLSYLKQFPIDVVKVDRSFVVDLERDRSSHCIVEAIIGLAHGLHMRVVAEGIETSAQHEHLARLGCESCQGHYFAHPMSADELGAALDDHGRLRSTLPLVATGGPA